MQDGPAGLFSQLKLRLPRDASVVPDALLVPPLPISSVLWYLGSRDFTWLEIHRVM